VQAMQEGQTIKHDVYGLGIVTASDNERTTVDFDDHGPKLFVTSIMTAELIGEAPATPPKTIVISDDCLPLGPCPTSCPG